MMIRDSIEKQGNWLFRWRSFLPLLMAPLFLVALANFTYPHGSRHLDELWEVFCLAVSALGIAVRVSTTGCTPRHTSGRNTSKGQVASQLNTTGMYSLMRHPLYVGNFLMTLGPVLVFRSWWLDLLYPALFWLYYERIAYAEEAFLVRKFGDVYRQWAGATPAFIPRLSSWTSPAMSFCWRTAVKREYQSVFALIAVFFCLELATDRVASGFLRIDAAWAALFVTGLVAFIVIRIIRKSTNLLSAHGR